MSMIRVRPHLSTVNRQTKELKDILALVTKDTPKAVYKSYMITKESRDERMPYIAAQRVLNRLIANQMEVARLLRNPKTSLKESEDDIEF